jgi:hypothetical protein
MTVAWSCTDAVSSSESVLWLRTMDVGVEVTGGGGGGGGVVVPPPPHAARPSTTRRAGTRRFMALRLIETISPV